MSDLRSQLATQVRIYEQRANVLKANNQLSKAEAYRYVVEDLTVILHETEEKTEEEPARTPPLAAVEEAPRGPA